jgi:hypothetical protein
MKRFILFSQIKNKNGIQIFSGSFSFSNEIFAPSAESSSDKFVGTIEELTTSSSTSTSGLNSFSVISENVRSLKGLLGEELVGLLVVNEVGLSNFDGLEDFEPIGVEGKERDPDPDNGKIILIFNDKSAIKFDFSSLLLLLIVLILLGLLIFSNSLLVSSFSFS